MFETKMQCFSFGGSVKQWSENSANTNNHVKKIRTNQLNWMIVIVCCRQWKRSTIKHAHSIYRYTLLILKCEIHIYSAQWQHNTMWKGDSRFCLFVCFLFIWFVYIFFFIFFGDVSFPDDVHSITSFFLSYAWFQGLFDYLFFFLLDSSVYAWVCMFYLAC